MQWVSWLDYQFLNSTIILPSDHELPGLSATYRKLDLRNFAIELVVLFLPSVIYWPLYQQFYRLCLSLNFVSYVLLGRSGIEILHLCVISVIYWALCYLALCYILYVTLPLCQKYLTFMSLSLHWLYVNQLCAICVTWPSLQAILDLCVNWLYAIRLFFICVT